ncbi:carboxymuconolactone decarboxylase family protein [Ferroplasma sp.]|uniref:carboxymuconolactone decarboxylase family protein n=1 Tax=Ferroplasma sp. TaxID=2591003 RepID=UPI002628EBC8|nr:carboxymuconolactone decarboxylase family protein [Ferroplasma sp.]MCL4453824.1 carboxymuconolactone decarboxylase family protein [Candidatus Thermoplasmatota archaeon]
MDANKKLQEVNRVIMEADKDNKDFTSSFMNFMGATMKGGSLDTKTKELLALALGIAARCEWCISYHVHEAFNAGATRKELMEVGYVTVLMYGSQALMEMNSLIDAINQFEKQ